jgi:hypothetical protein
MDSDCIELRDQKLKRNMLHFEEILAYQSSCVCSQAKFFDRAYKGSETDAQEFLQNPPLLESAFHMYSSVDEQYG